MRALDLVEWILDSGDEKRLGLTRKSVEKRAKYGKKLIFLPHPSKTIQDT